MKVADLKTAAEVREHARKVQQRLNQQKLSGKLSEQILAPKEVPSPKIVPDVVRKSPLMERKRKRRSPPRESMLPKEQLEAAPVLMIAEITKLISERSGLSFDEITFPSRIKRFYQPRYIGYYISYQFGFPIRDIKRAFACRHSKSITYGVNFINDRIVDGDQRLLGEINGIGTELAEKIFNSKWTTITHIRERVLDD